MELSPQLFSRATQQTFGDFSLEQTFFFVGILNQLLLWFPHQIEEENAALLAALTDSLDGMVDAEVGGLSVFPALGEEPDQDEEEEDSLPLSTEDLSPSLGAETEDPSLVRISHLPCSKHGRLSVMSCNSHVMKSTDTSDSIKQIQPISEPPPIYNIISTSGSLKLFSCQNGPRLLK